MENELRPFWGKLFNFNWKFGTLLILIICIPRFILVLIANSSGDYGSIGIIMALSAIIPFLFLSKYGQRRIGLTTPKKFSWLIVAFFAGLFASVILYVLGVVMYGNSDGNWYKYIGKSYKIPLRINGSHKAIMFGVMSLTGMTVSPIGEELFFRGIVHSSFAKSIGDKKASIIDSAAFALTHISHFGLVFINSKWSLLMIPTFIWVLSMFFVSVLFYIFKKRAGSIWGAVICHSAFNLGMIYCIFYLM